MKPTDITKEELELAKSYIILSVVQQIFARDIKRMSEMPLKLGHIYIERIKKALAAAKDHYNQVGRGLYKAGIKVNQHRRTTREIVAEYQCRGYIGWFEMDWETIQEEAIEQMKVYLE